MEERENTQEFRLNYQSADRFYDSICTAIYQAWIKLSEFQSGYVKITVEFHPEGEEND